MPFATKRWMVASGKGPPPPSFSLFSGKYEWMVYRGEELLRRENVVVE